MQAKTILVTGATDGIGKQTALELAQMGAHLLVHGRNQTKVNETVAWIQPKAGHERVEGVVADLSSLGQVRRLAKEVASRCERLDVLLHNAGVYMTQHRLTVDGYEMTFAVNHLAPFLLTHLLLPLIQKNTPARLITVSSAVHQRGRIEFDNLQAEKQFNPYAAYAQSKLANVLFAYECAERLAGTGITSNTLHPGVITTKLLAQGFNMTGDTVEAGAATSVYLASAPELAETTGQYFNKKRATPSASATQDRELRAELWRVSEKLVGISV